MARPTATRIVGSATVPTVKASTGPWLMGFAVRTNLPWDMCRKACNGVDYVLHQAALGSVPRSIEDPIKTNASNITGILKKIS